MRAPPSNEPQFSVTISSPRTSMRFLSSQGMASWGDDFSRPIIKQHGSKPPSRRKHKCCHGAKELITPLTSPTRDRDEVRLHHAKECNLNDGGNAWFQGASRRMSDELCVLPMGNDGPRNSHSRGIRPFFLSNQLQGGCLSCPIRFPAAATPQRLLAMILMVNPCSAHGRCTPPSSVRSAS